MVKVLVTAKAHESEAALKIIKQLSVNGETTEPDTNARHSMELDDIELSKHPHY